MKILWFSDWLIPTGLSKVSRYLIQGLRKDFEIAIATPYMAGSPLILDGLLIFPMLRFDRALFLSALERFDPDLVIAYISHFIPPYNEISALVRQYGAKLLWYVPVEYDEVSPSFCFPLLGANLIATPTRAGKRVLEEFIPEDFIHVVPHGVDRSIYKPKNPKPKPQPLSDQFIFGFVGKNNFRKDLPALIEAFARLSPDVKEKSCLYLHTPKKSTAGEVVYWPLQWLIVKNGLEAKVLAPENLTMWEGVEEEKMAEIYGMMDCYVHPSFGEGFCTVPDALVVCRDRLKPISEVRVGDYVLTHKGRFKKVLKVMKRRYRGPLVRVKPAYLNRFIYLTPEHPVLVRAKRKWKRKKGMWKFKKPLVWAPAILLGRNFYVAVPRVRDDSVELWVPSYVGENTKVKSGEVVAIGRNQFGAEFEHPKAVRLPARINPDEDFLRLAGYYLAEGCSDINGIAICFSSNEKEMHEEVIKILSDWGIKTRYREGERHRATTWGVGRMLGRLMGALFGKTSHEKRIPPFLLQLPKDKLQTLLGAYIAGDGHIEERECGEYVEMTTVSEELALSLFLLLAKLGIPTSISDGTHRDHGYKLTFTPNWTSGKPRGGKAERTTEHIYLPIKEIEIEEYDGYVYNLEVEEDNSYCIEGIAVHNCLPVLEAMACGIPVIASKNSSLPEVVGDAGILVECDPEPYFTREGWVHHRTKISALRDAMELVFRDEELRGKLARRGLERASEFTWERACEEMKKAIEKAMRHHRLTFLRRGKDHEAEGFLSEREISEQGDAEDKERPPEVCSSRRGADG